MKYQDLVYFGYEWDDDSKGFETDFIKEIKEKFPNVELRNAFDYIKGHRQEVYLDDNETDENYYAWLIAFGWLEFSFSCQLMMMSPEKEMKGRFRNYVTIAKSLYPEKFKSNKEINDENNN